MSSPAQGELRPSVYQFRLGRFEVATILDSRIVSAGLSPSYSGYLMSDDLRQLARANRIDPDRYEHPFIPTVVHTGDRCQW
jgi:hypothetical protein